MIALLESGWSARLRAQLGDEDFTAAYQRGRQRNGQQELAALLKLPAEV
jgi:hypothetical protein